MPSRSVSFPYISVCTATPGGMEMGRGVAGAPTVVLGQSRPHGDDFGSLGAGGRGDGEAERKEQ